ncbi:hypothetical protein DPMN_151713 [Dreissena polymorpha]|uniref:Uncharacterized protein n=1 Tax=Dreissena polymorpha TaxID=45954 RepID=A0A9D4J786_DREPO|nr:hypothetical protein DPMN_151713 [Dreissena polymorpha]
MWILLNTAAPADCSEQPKVLPCIEHILLYKVTISTTWLRSLFSTLLLLDHTVTCKLEKCNITWVVEDAVRGSDTTTDTSLMFFKNEFTILETESYSPGLWGAHRGLNIKRLSLIGGINDCYAIRKEWMLQSLSSLTHWDTLNIEVNLDSPGLWEAVHGLNIKRLSLMGGLRGLYVIHAESMSQSLASLKKLDTLSIEVKYYNPALWEALHGLNIKSLNLSGGLSNYSNEESILLPSLKKLETLSLCVHMYIGIKLPQTLKHFNVYCSALLPSELREHLDTLSACTQALEFKIEFGCASSDVVPLTRIPPEEYTAIQQELGTSKNVAVK